MLHWALWKQVKQHPSFYLFLHTAFFFFLNYWGKNEIELKWKINRKVSGNWFLFHSIKNSYFELFIAIILIDIVIGFFFSFGILPNYLSYEEFSFGPYFYLKNLTSMMSIVNKSSLYKKKYTNESGSFVNQRK